MTYLHDARGALSLAQAAAEAARQRLADYGEASDSPHPEAVDAADALDMAARYLTRALFSTSTRPLGSNLRGRGHGK